MTQEPGAETGFFKHVFVGQLLPLRGKIEHLISAEHEVLRLPVQTDFGETGETIQSEERFEVAVIHRPFGKNAQAILFGEIVESDDVGGIVVESDLGHVYARVFQLCIVRHGFGEFFGIHKHTNQISPPAPRGDDRAMVGVTRTDALNNELLIFNN